VEEAFAKMRKEGKKSIKEIEDLEQLAREIQYRVVTRKLVPVTRSFYHRTAFQLPGDARVRISLDTELTMTREDNLDGKQRAGKNWRRMDIGIDWPFSQLPPADVERFPYAVLEVKLQTQAGQEPPQWIRDLIASHLVEAVPKFSKFIHGTATMFPNRINLLPFWFPQMDVDIRKPITHRFGIERPANTASYSTSDVDDDDYDSDDPVAEAAGMPAVNGSQDTEDETSRRLKAARQIMDAHTREQDRDDMAEAMNGHTAPGNSLDEEERVAAMSLADDEYLYDSDADDEENKLEEARHSGSWTFYPLLLKHHIQLASDGLLNMFHKIPTTTPLPQNGAVSGGVPSQMTNGVQVKRFKAPKGKRIHVPVRVEPKVYFAAERTFLSWLEFSIIIGSIAATLLNFGDNVSLLSAWGFTIVACAALVYSVIIYWLRVQMIRGRRASVGRYYDKYGTTALCVGLIAATSVSFVFRIKEDGWFRESNTHGEL
jgi:uncharacterized membrane protein YidH (DUF202 family)